MSRHKLSQRQEELVLNNIGIIRYVIKKCNVFYNINNYEDIVSIGKVGLIQAALNFDASKKITFCTYAHTCIKNEYVVFFRENMKNIECFSLEDSICTNKCDTEMTYGDTLMFSNDDFTLSLMERANVKKLLSIILNFLEPRKRLIMLYRLANTPQKEIAGVLNIARSYISMIESEVKQDLKYYFEILDTFEEIFSVEIKENFYAISFSTKRIPFFKEIATKILQSPKFSEKLCKITPNKGRWLIQISKDLEAFYILANIMQEIDTFNKVPQS